MEFLKIFKRIQKKFVPRSEFYGNCDKNSIVIGQLSPHDLPSLDELAKLLTVKSRVFARITN